LGADLPHTAARWYASVFRPVSALLQARRLDRLLPREGPADLFVRVATQRTTEARDKLPVSWEEAVRRVDAMPPPLIQELQVA
jgi:hypothetical protein